MKVILILILIIVFVSCEAQINRIDISMGIGLSGTNQLFTNDIDLIGKLKFNQRLNKLDNKYRNNALPSAFIFISKTPRSGLLKECNLKLGFSVYNFGSTYFKEDKFSVSFGLNDTINTPNWIVAKYSPFFIELGISRKISVLKNVDVDLGLFFGYMIELYGTSKLTLLDSAYQQIENQIFYFNKDYPNKEYDEINYGFRTSISLYAERVLHPLFTYTQGLNDISKEDIHINQHANIWSLTVGLVYRIGTNKDKVQGKLE